MSEMPPQMSEFDLESRQLNELNNFRQGTQPMRTRPFTHFFWDLMMWRHIKDSAFIFGSGLTLLIALTYFSIISVFAYASFGVIILTGTLVFGRQLVFSFQQRTDVPHPFQHILDCSSVISPEYVHQQVDNILHPFNRSLTRMRNLYLADSLAETLKMAFYMYLLTYIGAWFNLMTLVIMGWVGAFTIPKIYTMYRRQIDGVLNMFMGYFRQIRDRISAAFYRQRERVMSKRSAKIEPTLLQKKVTIKQEVKTEKVQ